LLTVLDKKAKTKMSCERIKGGDEGNSAPSRLIALAAETRHDDQARVARQRRFDTTQRLELTTSLGDCRRVLARVASGWP
jgi:hypothetical protein